VKRWLTFFCRVQLRQGILWVKLLAAVPELTWREWGKLCTIAVGGGKRMKNWGRWLIERLVHVCWWLLDIYHELKPCRFSFIVAILGAIVFLWVNQGTEVLRALAEPGGKTGATNGARLGLFALGLLLWALASWYSARVLLYFDFPEADRSHFERSKGWERFHGWLRCQVPRFLGFLPMAIVGWSFLRARHTYEAGAPVRLLYFGMLSLLAGILLYVFFVLRPPLAGFTR